MNWREELHRRDAHGRFADVAANGMIRAAGPRRHWATAWEARIRARYPGVKIDLYVPEHRDDAVILDWLVVPTELQGKGTGTRIMRDLCRQADKRGHTLYVTPALPRVGSQAQQDAAFDRLWRFYHGRFGFEWSDERDDNIGEWLMRRPRPPQPRPRRKVPR